MRILFICPRLDVKGGISSVIQGYYSSELPQRHQLFLVASHIDGNKFSKLIRAIFGLFEAFFCIYQDKIDIVHIHAGDIVSFKRKYLYILLSKIMRRKIIYHHHGANFQEHYNSATKFWKQRVKRVFESVDQVICLSDSWRKSTNCIAPSAKVKVIPNAVFVPNIFQKPKHTNIRLTFLGLIGDRKGIFDLLIVIKRLITNGYNIELSIGGNGDIKRLKSSIKRLGLEKYIHFLGWIDDTSRDRLLKQTDIFILPSYAEGMPMSILEAMAYGIPVVSTLVGGIPELVKDEDSGILFNPGDLMKLYECIARLINSEGLRDAFGTKARNIIIKKHSTGRTIRLLENTYKDVYHSLAETR